ncbi:hypothetical protein ACF0H5_022756 [Mactra antiquata]
MNSAITSKLDKSKTCCVFNKNETPRNYLNTDNDTSSESSRNGYQGNSEFDSSETEEGNSNDEMGKNHRRKHNSYSDNDSAIFCDDTKNDGSSVLFESETKHGIYHERERPKSCPGVFYSTVSDDVSIKSCHSYSKRSSSNMSSRSSSEPEVKSFSWRKLSRDQWIILSLTCLSSLVSFLSLSIMAPFFPLEADRKNVNTTISGWIFGVYALVQFLASPLFGHIMPKVGSRFMFIAGLFICGGCSFLFGLLDRVDTSEDITLFVVLCLITRILQALGSTGLNNSGLVFISKYFPDNVTTVFGIAEVFTGVGLVIGPALGGFLYAAGGFIFPFAVVGGACMITLPFTWYFIPQQDDSMSDEEGDISIKEIILHPRSIVNSIVIVVATSVWSVLDPTLEPHLRVYGLGPEMVGLLFLIMAAVYSVTSPIWGRVADYLPDNRILLIPGLLLCAVGLLLAGPSPTLGFDISYNEIWLTILSLVILGVGNSMSSIPTVDVYLDVLDDLGYPETTRTYGMVSGMWMSMYALGDFTGPILGGFLFDQIGFEWLVTWIAAACALTAFLVCVTWYCEKRCCHKRLSNHKTDYVTERTPLLRNMSDVDILNTYPPGALEASYSSV